MVVFLHLVYNFDTSKLIKIKKAFVLVPGFCKGRHYFSWPERNTSSLVPSNAVSSKPEIGHRSACSAKDSGFGTPINGSVEKGLKAIQISNLGY